SHELHSSHGEGTISMKFPLIVLAALTVGSGFIPFGKFVSGDGKGLETHFNLLFSIAPVLLALTGISVAIYLFLYENEYPEKYSKKLGALYTGAKKKFYVDELYIFLTKKIIFNLIGRPVAWIDKNIVDGLMNGIASTTAAVSGFIKGIQSGKVQGYALYFFGGIVALAIVFLYWWK
ncbi:MAG: NADH-quinone oxidoreductase subunit L, partial [Bacteroidia bacterium]|nr:NADH-quinone oxidoreductase subunit L [Bacteroidia bacterium]